MNIETKQIEEAVIKQCVEEIVSTFSDPDHAVASAIHQQATKLLKERIEETINSKVKEVVEHGIEKLIIQPTNTYGEQKGNALTVREFIGSAVTKAMTEYVDSNGKPTDDSWYRKPENMRINQIIAASLGPMIQTEVNAMSAKLKSQIGNLIGEFVKVKLAEASKKFATL